VPIDDDLTAKLERFEGVSLKHLDERASLLRRVDNKYAVGPEQFLRLLDRLRRDHSVLDIDGRRAFAYETTYFETHDLRCFTDHVEDRRPRFKARTRCYLESDYCVFEVKLKRQDGETDKRQIDYSPKQRRTFTDEARRSLEEALREADVEPPDRMEAAIHTSFRRVTFAANTGAERVTCDFGVRLTAQSGADAEMRDGLVLVETKTEDGQSPADAALAEMGLEPTSLSKYRVGMGLLGPSGDDSQPGSQFFVRR
jgi:hypothetical protein